jgi:hypothetical protein
MKFISVLAACSLFLGSNLLAEKMDAQVVASQCVPSKEVALQQGMRKLWTDHVVWTRLYIISAVSKSEDLSAVTARLLKNQEDIGNALIPFYGKDAAAGLTKLLKEHILIGAVLVQAAITNDKDAEKKADQKWHDNAIAIADFLSKANSYWPRQDLVNMLNRHLELTAQEATYRIQKQWEKDISTFDQIVNQILEMADTLSAGISNQFLKAK